LNFIEKNGGSFISTDSRIINQLPFYLQVQFPAVLTSKYACDNSVITLMKSRKLSNLVRMLLEMHSEQWIKNHMEYLEMCEKYKTKLTLFQKDQITFKAFPPFKELPLSELPLSQWFIAAYLRDVWSRLDSSKAQITSMFGDELS